MTRPFLLDQTSYIQALPSESRDFQRRMRSIFGAKLAANGLREPHVLLLTRAADGEADLIGLHLAAAGIPYVRVDADLDLEDVGLTIGGSGSVQIATSASADATFGAVLFRHFDISAIGRDEQDETARLLRQREWGVMLQVLADDLGAVWINPPRSVQRLTRIAQLRLAKRAGFSVPRTIVSTDAEAIAAFAGQCGGDLIAKVLGDHFIESEPGRLAGIFPQVLSESGIQNLGDALPTIYQERVEFLAEIRVTVAGNEMLALEVEKRNPAAIWTEPELTAVRAHTLPKTVVDRVRAFMRLADLRYGAIDLLLTADGKYVFLEVNPAGDWLWLESKCRACNITERVVELLRRSIHQTSSGGIRTIARRNGAF